ncbi:hypothetical protein LY76DRAFT_1796 [Colletotrichum caudatum]|nr:hypothetical protein LY76DRAFT_1796 [Colletotrichum caudatum]
MQITNDAQLEISMASRNAQQQEDDEMTDLEERRLFWLPTRGATLRMRCLRTGPAGQCLHFDRRGRRMLPLYDDKAASEQVEGPVLRQWIAMVGGVEGTEKKTRFLCLRLRGSSIRVRLYGSISSCHGPGCLMMAGTLLIDPHATRPAARVRGE